MEALAFRFIKGSRIVNRSTFCASYCLTAEYITKPPRLR
jgi:hypothetical protein